MDLFGVSMLLFLKRLSLRKRSWLEHRFNLLRRGTAGFTILVLGS